MNPIYNNLPSDFAHPGGFVESVMDFINETAVCPQPLFALGAALSLAGILYGRRVQSEDGQRTNLFVMAVGYTSCGKNAPLRVISRILDECGATELRLGQVTSDSAIEWALKRQPRQIALIDEAGHYFGGVSDPNAKGTPQHAIKPALLELWSSANGCWKGKQRVPRDGKECPPVVVEYPHFCLYATTQPQILFESLSRNDLRDGWLSRNLFFISKTRPKPEPKPLRPLPNAIRGEVLAWKDSVGTPPPGTAAPRPPIVTVPTDEAARAIFAAFGDEVYARMMTADRSGDETNYLYGKAAENAIRIALILAVSRDNDRPVIGEREATFATKLVRYLIGEVIRVVRANVAESADEKAKKRILQILAQAGREGLTKNELTRKTQFIGRRNREEYIDDLAEAGEIVVTEDAWKTARIKLAAE